MQHLEHLSLILRGRRSTWSTSVSFCVAGAALGAPPSPFCAASAARGETSAEVRRGLSTVDAGCVCVAGTALGAPQPHFAWQAQHLEHLSLILRGRCCTRSTSVSFCVAGAARGAPAERSAEVRRRLSTVMGSFKGSCSIIIPFCTSTHHHLHTTISTTLSTQHHLHYIIKHNIINTHHLHYIIKHNIINTTSSTHHHLNNTIYTTPPAQHHPPNTHHLHYRCSTWSTAILPLLPHSC